MKNFLRQGSVSLTVVLKKHAPDAIIPIDAEDAVSIELLSGENGSRYLQYSAVAADIVSIGLDTSLYEAGVYRLRATVATASGVFSAESEEFSLSDSESLTGKKRTSRDVITLTIVTEPAAPSELPDNIQDIIADPTRGGGGLIKATYFYRYMLAWANNIDPVTGRVISPDVKMPRVDSIVDTANAWSILMIMARLKSVENGGQHLANWFYKFVDKVYPDGEKGNAMTGLNVKQEEDADGNHTVTIEYDKTFLDILEDSLQTVAGPIDFDGDVKTKKTLTVGEPAPERGEKETEESFKARFVKWYAKINGTVAAIIYGGLTMIGDLAIDGSLDVEHDLDVKGDTVLEGNATIVGDVARSIGKSTNIGDVEEAVAERQYYELVTVNANAKKRGRARITGKKKGGKGKANEDVYLSIDDIKSAKIAGWSFRIDGVEVARIDANGITGGDTTEVTTDKIIPADENATIGELLLPFMNVFSQNIITKNITRTYTADEDGATLTIGVYAKGAGDSVTPDVEIKLAGSGENINDFSVSVTDKVDPNKSTKLKLNNEGLWFNGVKIAPTSEAIWSNVNDADFAETAGIVEKGDTVRSAIYKVQTQIKAIGDMYNSDIHVSSGALTTKANGSISFPFRSLEDAIAAVGTSSHKVIRIWRLESVEDIVIEDVRELTIRGEFDSIDGRPTVRTLTVGENTPGLIIEHLSVERSAIVNNNVNSILFNGCEFIGSFDGVVLNNANVKFANCYFRTCDVKSNAANVVLEYCEQDNDGIYIQDGGSTTLSTCKGFTVIHDAGILVGTNSYFTKSERLPLHYGGTATDVVGNEGIVSEAESAESNGLFLYGGSMAIRNEYSALVVKYCRFIIAGLNRDSSIDTVTGERLATGIQDADIVSSPGEGGGEGDGYLKGETIGEKLAAIGLALSSPVNILRNSNIVIHPELYGVDRANINVSENTALIEHTDGVGAIISITVPREYRSPGSTYTATLELSVPTEGEFDIIVTAEAGQPLAENIVTVDGGKLGLADVTFVWSEDEDLVLSWQVNDPEADLIVRNGVMLSLGNYTGVWKESVYDAYSVKDVSTDLVLSPLCTGDTTSICQTNKTTLHLELFADVTGVDYEADNLVMSGVPLKDLDEAFINNRIISVALIPDDDSLDCAFQGYAKLVDDSVYLIVRRSIDTGELKSIAFSTDFNIVKPLFAV
jgi:hypothetical protein